jgi:hypothetical protein
MSLDPALLIPAGAWLWGVFGGKVTEQAGKLLGDSARQGWEKIDWPRAAERYRQEMQTLYGELRTIGMAEPHALADIFTDVYLFDKPSALLRYGLEELERQAQLEGTQSQQLRERHAALDIVKKQNRLFILGKPGAGKTTLLKHLVLQCTTGKLDAVPIFVGFKAWADSGLMLMPFLTKQFTICNFPDAQSFIEHILSEGRAIVLFDGLDEVSQEQGAHDRVSREVGDFVDQYQGSRYVITCRTAATERVFSRFTYCELADFTEAQVERFVSFWFHDKEDKRKAFLDEFKKPEHKRLHDLSRTPLLLTLLCLTFDETMTFPKRKAEIYEEALDALLKKWDAERSIKRDIVYKKLSLGYKHQLLMELAAETFERGNLFMRKQDVINRIVRFIRRLPMEYATEDIDGEAILRAIEAQHGLLIEQARHIYSFSHLTFHEYFTAQYIATHPEPSIFYGLVGHAADPRWAEVLALSTSILDYRNVARLFRIWFEHMQQQIETNLELMACMQWTARHSHSAEGSYRRSVRATMLALALIDWGIDCTCAIDRALACALNHVNMLEHALARARALHITIARITAPISHNVNILANYLRDTRPSIHNLASAIAPDFSLERALDHTNSVVRTLNHAIKSVREIDGDLMSDLASKRHRVINQYIDQAINHAQDLGDAIKRALDHANNLISALNHAGTLNRLIRTIAPSIDGTSTNPALTMNEHRFRVTHWYSVLQCAVSLQLDHPTTDTEEKPRSYEHLVNLLNQILQQATAFGNSIEPNDQQLATSAKRPTKVTKRLKNTQGARTVPRIIEPQTNSQRPPELDIWLAQRILTCIPSPTMTDSATWTAFATTTRKLLIQHHNIGNPWQFTSAGLAVLETYLASTECLVECLKGAVIEDREYILNHLLPVPDERITEKLTSPEYSDLTRFAKA